MAEATYQVRVSGAIPADLLADLPHLTVTVEPPETVLHGSLPDQSALFGLIARIHGLGLRLIEVRRVAGDESSGSAGSVIIAASSTDTDEPWRSSDEDDAAPPTVRP